jgi:hypothetical protein
MRSDDRHPLKEEPMNTLRRTLPLLCLAAVLMAPAGAFAADPAGIKVALKSSDSGNLLARCNNCVPKGAYPDNAAVHVPASPFPPPAYAQFYLQKLANGKYALQSVDSSNYVARCNNCVPGGAYPDSAFVHVTPAQLASSPWAQFNLVRLSNGKYALQADSGNYLARCNNCIPGGAKPDNAFVHVTQAQLDGSPWAQWDIIVIP